MTLNFDTIYLSIIQQITAYVICLPWYSGKRSTNETLRAAFRELCSLPGAAPAAFSDACINRAQRLGVSVALARIPPGPSPNLKILLTWRRSSGKNVVGCRGTEHAEKGGQVSKYAGVAPNEKCLIDFSIPAVFHDLL